MNLPHLPTIFSKILNKKPKQTNTNDLLTIFEKYKYDPSIVLKSKKWFNQQVKELTNVNINRNQLFKEKKVVSTIIPGRMYSFYYDPKYKDTLPYYDVFPLVIPWPYDNKHFMGLNLHYLHPYQRMVLLTKLMKFSTNSNLDDNTRINLSWQLISNASKYPFVAPCVKMYLFSHVSGQFIDIPSYEWHTALMLPTAQFVGAKTSHIWNSSSKVNR